MAAMCWHVLACSWGGLTTCHWPEKPCTVHWGHCARRAVKGKRSDRRLSRRFRFRCHSRRISRESLEVILCHDDDDDDDDATLRNVILVFLLPSLFWNYTPLLARLLFVWPGPVPKVCRK
uniref:Secreted protein n=1 Tax=Anopheles darlingi TaxID=43151 RepID=A0A2M4D7D1_ANODA